MGYLEDNANKIASAFERFRSASELTMLTGMKAVLDAGVEYCLKEHDDSHPRHKEGDGYGWVLIHNGVEVERKLYGTDEELRGNANDSLSYVVSKSPTQGWVGIVLASVKPASYFRIVDEFAMMRGAIRTLKSDDFSRHFKTFAV